VTASTPVVDYWELIMRYVIPGTKTEFEIPDEWLRSAGMEHFVPNAEHYYTDLRACSDVVLLEEIEPPLRTGEFWFRNRESVVEVFNKMRAGENLEPIEVWSRHKKNSAKLIVRDGFHRFYLSIAAGYQRIPVRINDFDIKEFLERERTGGASRGPAEQTS